MRCQFLALRRVLISGVTSCLLLLATPAFAAERVLLKYSVLREPISVQELSTFAQTGKLSNKLLLIITLAQQDPDIIRQYLTTPVKINPVVLDKVLNSEIGIATLDRLSQVIHPPSQKGDRQALHSAFVLSASQDEQITLLEIIQNYPTAEVEIEGDRLEGAYRQLRRLQESLQDILSPQ
ncbi:alpha/beta hydrolase [Dendronalium sp. ChiSLP03b]|uniref:alpha/beta hydrolase n=1 Tax=Dendronalium sp. ChiSLP03b TaxID=3075381 RepID=UPI002AD3AE22|nr:alpha/beta hydrolase [Dendronalium sp. ChiSLP03b]MDZ8207455.1 alpha/beta hydrolase [Dendronalium sp. ChiSLP03b]